MTPITAVVIGAGNRGHFAYGSYALEHPHELSFVGVAEPDPMRLARFAGAHDVAPDAQHAAWRDLLARPRMARAALVCTQDADHVEPVLAALRAGYDVLLEKPMATSAADCARLADEAERLGRTLQVCHVLRYTPFFTKLHEIVHSGRLGRIMTIEHRENVSWYHMAHSFVRGNWRNAAESTPMILAKCCHDLDILLWLMGEPVTQLSSMGGLRHFTAANAPQGAPRRCTDGCPVEANCIWYAPRLYGADVPARSALPAFRERRFMQSALQGGQTPESRRAALAEGWYGRCVYHCDNDVVDHQIIAMQFAGGATCTFTMHGHSDREGRTMRWDGTRATLHGDFDSEGAPQSLTIIEHGTGVTERIEIPTEDGHGGGDHRLMADFVAALNGRPSPHQTTARASLASHLMAFAAEQSRLAAGARIDMASFSAAARA